MIDNIPLFITLHYFAGISIWISFRFLFFQSRRSFNLTLPVKWNPFRRYVGLSNGNWVCVGAKFSSSVIGKKRQRIDSNGFAVGSFPRIDFYLSLETGHKSIFYMKIIFLRLSFFDQSEFEKKLKSISRVFCDWKRLTSEHWLQ